MRITIINGPKTGKTTLANAIGSASGVDVRHSDDLIPLGWSESSQYMADEWLSDDVPCVIEGVAVVRALRKWLAANETGKPVDRIIRLEEPYTVLLLGQMSMTAGHDKIWREIEEELLARGVEIRPHT